MRALQPLARPYARRVELAPRRCARAVLDSGGFRTKQTLSCINDTLEPFAFRVSVVGDDWYVSDGKLRMIRFTGDGVVVTGGATELAPATAGPGPSARVVKAGAQRFRPY